MGLLAQHTLLAGNATLADVAAHERAGSPARLLDEFDAQEGGSLCWAAVTSALTGYYARLSPELVRARTQCEVAHTQFPEAGCCSDLLANCDCPWTVSEPLYDCGVLNGRRGRPLRGPASPEVLEAQIAQGRPVVLQIAHAPGADGRPTRTHFIVVDGAVRLPAVNGWLFHVWDPAPAGPAGTVGTAVETSWMGLNAYYGRGSSILAMFLTMAREG